MAPWDLRRRRSVLPGQNAPHPLKCRESPREGMRRKEACVRQDLGTGRRISRARQAEAPARAGCRGMQGKQLTCRNEYRITDAIPWQVRGTPEPLPVFQNAGQGRRCMAVQTPL
ncbi:MAG: hypothetical protein II543_06370, partial [Desulfovibrio sp.]|nr:hypothetical protein [Desulfovibrio sp.]